MGFDLNILDSGIIRDLALLGLVELKESNFYLSEIGNELTTSNYEIILLKQAYKIPKIKIVTDFLVQSKEKITAKSILKSIPNILEDNLTNSSKLIYAGYILQWAKFITEKASLHNTSYNDYIG